ncbi:hypothetical protein D7Y52_15595 [Stenotrophomonas maltophilia]|uniref:hypothetical protein n=1 Tax=Stenotrophomonas maltophilia TaxID=40324 RepID=UPI000C259482|nr:hypothetical protein [Stenotrophomonas maltophilia]MBA0296091.1 hypothetical protein [Stenotrophomonas maltophilia]MBA0350241.1 hypothetical protein [Stenotrophomonas maltophilia]PJL54761.1 hypothetical protein B9Y73_07825 [Stenotrophomonas maltophilia]PJL56474.1 hypothetical protein B9Y60_07830 [Stenotrophomonas maltophilia]
MKSLTYSIVFVAALIGAVLTHFHLPKGALELKACPKVSAAEFAVMREEALSLAAEDAALGAGRFEARYFELTCRGKPALLVDNSSSQLLILDFISRATEAPCVQPLLQRWSSRLLPAD